MKTVFAQTNPENQQWWIVDASGKRLGRIATEIAKYIRGKHKPSYTPNADVGDFVVVINADKIDLSGNKLDDKMYYHHSLYFGGMKEFTAKQMLQREPTYVIEEAVRGMLPKNRLSRVQFNHLKAYAGAEHPHAAQKPQALNIN